MSVMNLDRLSRVYGQGLPPDSERDFDLSQMIAWRPDSPELGLVVDLLADEEDLHRNVCSVNLDKDMYPRLDSMPIWVTASSVLTKRSGFEQRLCDRMLWVHLQLMLYAHDYTCAR